LKGTDPDFSGKEKERGRGKKKKKNAENQL